MLWSLHDFLKFKRVSIAQAWVKFHALDADRPEKIHIRGIFQSITVKVQSHLEGV